MDVVDTSPRATNRIYDSDNPRINLEAMLIQGGTAAVGEVIIYEWTFMQKQEEKTKWQNLNS